MKNRVSVVCLLALAASPAMFAQGAAPTKIGVINIQAAILGTRDGKAAAKALDEKAGPKKKQLEQAQNEIQGLKDKYAKLSSVGSDDEKRKLQQDIDTRTKNFNRDVADAQQDLTEEQDRVLGELYGRLQAVVNKYGNENGYAVILDVSSQNTPVVFMANAVEVTQDIVAAYDKAAPAGPAGGATSAAPGAAPGAAPAKGAPAAPAGAKPPASAPKPGATK